MDIGHTTGPLISGIVALYFGFARHLWEQHWLSYLLHVCLGWEL